MKNKTFLQSILCALRGIKTGFKSEKNFKIYIAIAFTALIINIWLGVGVTAYCALAITVCAVFSAEYFNTAIEYAANEISGEYNPAIGALKDIAAAGVLVSGFAFFIVEGLVIGSKLL